MNTYLIFRTDRVGDFLISAILINNIIENDPAANITVVSSNKNYSYIKSFDNVNEVFLLENNFFGKIKLIFKLKKKNIKNIIIHDQKKRSIFISFFLKAHKKILLKKTDNFTQIKIIKNILSKLNFKFYETSLDVLNHKNSLIKKKEFAQLHFDEKWIHKDYIKKYINIEPTKNELISFIKIISIKMNNNLIITTGHKTPKILENIKDFLVNENIKLHENLNFLELENITLKSRFLISCHGAISHIASAKKITQIDIIDKSYNYKRWTEHFRNYISIHRKPFKELSSDIIKLL